jgi:hypothetical protein
MVLGQHFSSRADTVALAQPAHASRRCARAWCSGPARGGVVAQPTWLRRLPRCSTPGGDFSREDGGYAGQGGARGSHRRWPAVVEWRKRPDMVVFQGSSGALVAGDGVDESSSWRRG